jgi:hypothetical protein
MAIGHSRANDFHIAFARIFAGAGECASGDSPLVRTSIAPLYGAPVNPHPLLRRPSQSIRRQPRLLPKRDQRIGVTVSHIAHCSNTFFTASRSNMRHGGDFGKGTTVNNGTMVQWQRRVDRYDAERRSRLATRTHVLSDILYNSSKTIGGRQPSGNVDRRCRFAQ